MRSNSATGVEWPTVFLALACYAVWAAGTTYVSAYSLPLGILCTGVATALFSSLQHEIIHGHPFANRRLNQALVFPGLNLYIPFERFRDTHLAHHQDALLTDPFDDPESNYMDPGDWDRLPLVAKIVLTFNNTLFGRLIVGPFLGQMDFMRGDWRAIRAGDTTVATAWLRHIPALLVVLIWLAVFGAMPFWAYLVATYIGLSILKLRTFLEHQAEHHSSHRTVVIEDRGPLALIFLNNNLHIVHHMHPGVAWYELPALYFNNKERYLKRNGGYRYRSYLDVFAKYMWRTKDDVAHPIWRRG